VGVRRAAGEFHFAVAVHAAERGVGRIDHLLLLLDTQRYRVQRRGELTPVARRAIRMRGQVAGAKITVQAELGSHLVQNGAAQVGAFGHVQPPQRGGQFQIGRQRRDVSPRQGLLQVLQVARDLGQAAALAQVRQQCVQRRVGIQRIDAAVEAILHAQETGEIAAVGEDVAGHDALVQGTVAVAGGGLEPQAAAFFRGDVCVHGGMPRGASCCRRLPRGFPQGRLHR